MSLKNLRALMEQMGQETGLEPGQVALVPHQSLCLGMRVRSGVGVDTETMLPSRDFSPSPVCFFQIQRQENS